MSNRPAGKTPTKTKAIKPSRSLNERPLDIARRGSPRPGLASVWRLSITSCKLLWRYRLIFTGIVLLYGLVNFVVVQGFSAGTDPTSIKSQIDSLFHGQYKQLAGGLALFSIMLSQTGSSQNGNGAGYELFLLLIASLALIWAIRNTTNGATVRIRDAYYRGMFPLIPFILMILIIFVDMIPMTAGIGLYVFAIGYHIAVNGLEQAIFIIIGLALSALSLYFLSSSVIAMYIVTLPEMSPIKALRSAKKLVRGRRLAVLLRMIFLPIALLIVSLVVMIPVIIFVSHAAQWVLLLISLVFIAIFHSYLYNLYRELLEDEQG